MKAENLTEELLSNILLELRRIRKALENTDSPVKMESVKPKIQVHRQEQTLASALFGEQSDSGVDLKRVSQLLS